MTRLARVRPQEAAALPAVSPALWRPREQGMRGKHRGHCARPLVKEVATVRSLDAVLPIGDKSSQGTRPVRSRIVAWPDCPVAELLVRLGLVLPGTPK